LFENVAVRRIERPAFLKLLAAFSAVAVLMYTIPNN
jgi:hypothetical protein